MDNSIVIALQNIKNQFLLDNNTQLAIQNTIHTFEKFKTSRFDIAHIVFEEHHDLIIELTKQEYKNYFSNIENNYNALGKSEEFLKIVSLQIFQLSKNKKELSFLIMDMFKNQTSQHFSELVESIFFSKIKSIAKNMLQNNISFPEIQSYYKKEYKDTYYEHHIIQLIENIT